MTYEIRKNHQFNSAEIYFDGKPSEEVRNALKALKSNSISRGRRKTARGAIRQSMLLCTPHEKGRVTASSAAITVRWSRMAI